MRKSESLLLSTIIYSFDYDDDSRIAEAMDPRLTDAGYEAVRCESVYNAHPLSRQKGSRLSDGLFPISKE